jgi:hypothetical protein
MSLLAGILDLIIGGAEIALGILIEIGTLGGGTPLAVMLISSGIGMMMVGIGTLIAGDPPVRGFATTTRNSIAPWEIIYGESRCGGTIVHMNSWGDNDKMLDLVIVVAAHPCQSVNELLFDQQRIMLDGGTTGTSFTPVQQTCNITSIVRTIQGVVNVTLDRDIPYLSAGDQLTLQNVSTDTSLNGIFQVSEILSRTGGVVSFSYLNGGAAVSVTSEGQAVTRWPDYARNIYFEALTGAQTLGQTFAGMQFGTPYQGTGGSISPESPGQAGGTAVPNQWTNYCSLQNKTAVFLRLQYDAKMFPSGLPQISFHLTGKNDIFDPRTDTHGYTTNAALCIADYLSNTEFGFKAIYDTEIPLDSLIAGANVCDEAVDLVTGGTEPRYSLNGKFTLETRRGEVLSNLLTACAGRLTYYDGKYIIHPAQWVDPITPHVDLQAIAAGPMKWVPTVSIRDLYNGVKGTYISPDNVWQSTDIPYYAQDTNHGYSGGVDFGGDINLEADGGERRWLEIQLPFTISSGTAQRLAKIELLRRRHYGTGTFQCNMAGYQFVPLDIIQADSSFLGWTGKTVEVTAVRLRSEKVGSDGEGWLLGAELDVQETDSSIYDWSTEEELSPQGYVISTLPKDVFFEATPFPWSPGFVSPLPGDAFGGPASFGMQPVYKKDASSNEVVSMNFKGTAPINELSHSASPLIVVAGLGSGGTLPAGDYVVALTARDAGSPPYKLTNYHSFGHTNVPTDGGSITVNVTWGSGDDGGDLYIGKWTTFDDGYVFHHNQSLTSSDTSVAITDFDQTTSGGVDKAFDHFSVVLRQIVLSGPWTSVISSVTSTTITIPGPTVLSMTADQWAGYTLALLAKDDAKVETPLLYMPIASNTASDANGFVTFTVGPNASAVTLPDLTGLLGPGDSVGMCFNPTFTDSTFVELNVDNAFNSAGAITVKAGQVAVVLSGADSGDMVPIASVGPGAGTETVFSLSSTWKITPATGDLVVICNAADAPEILSLPIKSSAALTGTVASSAVANGLNNIWLFRVRTEDKNNNHCDDSLAPVRLAYLFASIGTPPYPWQANRVVPNATSYLNPTDLQFGLQTSLSATGTTVAVNLTISGDSVENVYSALPQIIAPTGFTVATGGTINGGQDIFLSLCAIDANTGRTEPSSVVKVAIPAGTNTNTVGLIAPVSWPTVATGWDLFAGPQPDTLTHQANGTGTPVTTDLTLTAPLNIAKYGLPDESMDHFRISVKKIIAGALISEPVVAVSGSSVTLGQGGVADASIVSSYSGCRMFLASKGNLSSIPLFDSPITGNSGSTFTLSESVVSTIAVGDVCSIYLFADIASSNTIGCSLLANSDAMALPSGLTGQVVRIIAGTGAEQTALIASNTATTVTIMSHWAIVPDSTSLFVVEEPTWTFVSETSALIDATPFDVRSLNVQVTNFQFNALLVMVQTMAADGTAADEAHSPKRLMWLSRINTGALLGNPQYAGAKEATFVFGQGSGGGWASVVVGNTTNAVMGQVGGTFIGWTINSAIAPTDTTVTSTTGIQIDVLKMPNGSSTPVSLFNAAPFALLPSGQYQATGQTFPNIQNMAAGDRLYAVLKQCGTLVPGEAVTMQLYYN